MLWLFPSIKRSRTKLKLTCLSFENEKRAIPSSSPGNPQAPILLLTREEKCHPAVVDLEGFYDQLFDHILTNTETSFAHHGPRGNSAQVGWWDDYGAESISDFNAYRKFFGFLPRERFNKHFRSIFLVQFCKDFRLV